MLDVILASIHFPSGWGNKLETQEILKEQYLFSLLILEDFFTAFVPSDLAFLPETHFTLNCQGTALYTDDFFPRSLFLVLPSAFNCQCSLGLLGPLVFSGLMGPES